MDRCIHNVFTAVPPEQIAEPAQEARLDADINLQAFVFNVFGALDNLAWIWTFERLTYGEKPNIARRDVNLNRSQSPIRASFSQPFREFLDAHAEWFQFQENYRHALAHRIPLYIPPSAVPTDDVGTHASLGQAMVDATMRADFDELERLRAAQTELGVFEPVMIHSFGEQVQPIMFHPQLLSDFETVEDIARRMLRELDDQPPSADNHATLLT
jgi:hypothetical protein